MNIFKKTGFFLLLCLSSHLLVAQEVENFFINGLGNDRDDAEKYSEAITIKLQDDQGTSFPAVQLLHNQSQNKVFDLYESGLQYFGMTEYLEIISDELYGDSVSYQDLQAYLDNQRNNSRDEVLLKTVNIAFSNGVDVQDEQFGPGMYLTFTEESTLNEIDNSPLVYIQLDRAIRTVLRSLFPFYGATTEAMDRALIKSTLNDVISADNAVNIIAHSQGNLFANLALEEFENEGGDASQAILLSVGTPDSKVHGNGTYVNLEEDTLMDIVSSLPPNYTNGAASWSHGIISDYLKSGTGSETLIINKFVSNYNQLSDNFPQASTDNIYMKTPSIDLSYAGAGDEIRPSVYQCYTGTKTNSVLENPNVAYYLSKNAGLDSSDILLDNDSSSLGTDDVCDIESDRINIPSGTEPGLYHIIFQADYLGEIDEFDETDNITYVTITVVSSPTQVATDDITVSESGLYDYLGNREYYLESRQNFEGDSTMDDITTNPRIGYYLSGDSIWSSDDLFLDDDPSSIGSDDVYDYEKERVTIPSSYASGNYYFLFVADYRNVIEETDENNNVQSYPIYIE